MKSLRDIQKIVARFNVKPGPEMRSKVLDEALEIQRNQNQQSKSDTKLNIWRIIMKSPITKLATAALIIIACLIGISFWRTTGSGIALADVLARVEQFKAYRCQWSTKVTGEDPNKTYDEQRATSLRSQEHGWKAKVEQLDPNGGQSTYKERYWLADKNTMILITPKEKKYWRIEAGDEIAKGLWKDSDPLTQTKRIMEYKYGSMGRATMDGIEVEGFQTTDPNWYGDSKNKVEVDVKMWADVKTRLPVRYDFTYAYFDQMGDKIIKRVHFVMHDFQWDVPVEAAEFEPVIPDDYTGRVVKYPAHSTEETAIQGLKLLVELFGKYSENITEVDATVLRLVEKSETPAAMRLKEEIKGLTDEEIIGSSKLVDFWMPIRGLAMFWYVLEDNKKDPAYYGKIVTPKDADKVLMRWKVSDTDLSAGAEYRVIYGDLHAENVTPAKLAELEAAMPK